MNVRSISRRTLSLIVAALLFAVAIIPMIRIQKAAAYNIPTDRTIQMSTSAVSAAGQYTIAWKSASTTTVKGIVVDFCTSPIISNTCTSPGGSFTVGTPTVTSQTGISGFTAGSANSGRTLTLTSASGSAMSVGTQVSFILTTATNPTALGTFYARILTYANDTGADSPGSGAGGYTNSGTPTVGNPIDAGGVAMSTAAQITITSKVQERLTFCVYTTGTGNDCTTKSGTAVTLGDTNGVLDPAGPYVDRSTKYGITTNAQGGAVVNLKGDTLTSGANTIAGLTTFAQSAAGTDQFGLCTYESAGSGLSIDTAYDGDNVGTNAAACTGTTQTAGTGSTGGANSAYFNLNPTNTNSTYGQTIATKAAGTYSTGTIAFLGNVSNSAVAGIYTTTLTFIATGTY